MHRSDGGVHAPLRNALQRLRWRRLARVWRIGTAGGLKNCCLRALRVRVPPRASPAHGRLAPARASAAPRRMSCSETSKPSSAKASRTSIKMTVPATIVGARSGCRPRVARRSASGIEARRASKQPRRDEVEPVAVDAFAGRRGRAPGRSRRATLRSRRRQSPPGRPLRSAAGTSRSISVRTSRLSAASSRAEGGSSRRWRSVWRTTPSLQRDVEADRAASSDHQLGRAAANVDHERGRWVARVAIAHRAEEGELRLLVAADDPRIEPVALTQ